MRESQSIYIRNKNSDKTIDSRSEKIVPMFKNMFIFLYK